MNNYTIFATSVSGPTEGGYFPAQRRAVTDEGVCVRPVVDPVDVGRRGRQTGMRHVANSECR